MGMHDMEHGQHNQHPDQPNAAQDESLLAILKRRYALGEITREQYEEMKRVLDLSETPRRTVTEHSHH